MENAVGAFKMAASVLIFVIALATSFFVFGKAKQAADSIIASEDKQAYLEEATLDNGILYTSSDAISNSESKRIAGVLKTNGCRIVGLEDIVSTIRRYADENYAVTVVTVREIKSNDGEIKNYDIKIKARFDLVTEGIMNKLVINDSFYNNLNNPESDIYKFYTLINQNVQNNAIPKINERLDKRIGVDFFNCNNVKFEDGNGNHKDISKKYMGRDTNGKYILATPWLTNKDETQKRITAEVYGGEYKFNGLTYTYDGFANNLENYYAYEVINEIDESEYLIDNDSSTGLLQKYQMPTVEIIYVIALSK